MSDKTLLLSASYEPVNFISERRMLKLVMKDKVDIISNWDRDPIVWASGQMSYPAVLRLKEAFKRSFYTAHFLFNRKEVVRRDKETCQYCFTKLSRSKVTIDHIIPKSLGGPSSFTNCVVSCQTCNSKKANKTLEQAGMVLLVKPVRPCFYSGSLAFPEDCWHPDWTMFLKRS